MQEEKETGSSVPPPRNGYSYVWRDLKHRTLEPLKQLTYVLYSFASVLGFGCFGIWLEFGKWLGAGHAVSSDALLSAFTTFIPALLGVSSLQVFLEDTANPMRMLSIVWMLLWCAIVVWLTFFSSDSRVIAFVVAVFGAVAAAWTWWIANALNEAFMDNLDANAPVGGSTNQTLGGDLSGFKH